MQLVIDIFVPAVLIEFQYCWFIVTVWFIVIVGLIVIVVHVIYWNILSTKVSTSTNFHMTGK